MKLLDRIWKRSPFPRKSYAQSGEDLIVSYLFEHLLQIAAPTYLDIGANHPFELSNTYHFYKRGFRGVCVEPNPVLLRRIQKARPGDVCLNVGIGSDDADAMDFYVVDPPTMSTFSKSEVESYAAFNYQVKQVIQVPIMSVQKLIPQHFSPKPNFVSLDTEGYDLPILQKWDFSRFRPEIFCVETVKHANFRKIPEISKVFAEHDYLSYGDTYINTIYVDRPALAKALDLTLEP